MILFYHSNNCISWYSESNNPDIGGCQNDDYRSLIPTDYLPSEVIKQGFYTNYCVEVDIGLLALNTVLNSDELKNIDKDASRIMEDNKGYFKNFE